jgi:hypothetical protein
MNEGDTKIMEFKVYNDPNNLYASAFTSNIPPLGSTSLPLINYQTSAIPLQNGAYLSNGVIYNPYTSASPYISPINNYPINNYLTQPNLLTTPTVLTNPTAVTNLLNSLPITTTVSPTTTVAAPSIQTSSLPNYQSFSFVVNRVSLSGTYSMKINILSFFTPIGVTFNNQYLEFESCNKIALPY